MLYFIDYKTKRVYIMAPKSGTTTIASYLQVPLHYIDENIQTILRDNSFMKIIIYRENLVSRFLSGFYEDLFNNSCYDDMEVTFDEYLLFIYQCFVKTIPNVNNMSIITNKNIPVWFGNCSNQTLNITDASGNFCSHIMSQWYAIHELVGQIKGDNVKLIELNSLNKFLENDIRCNVKPKSTGHSNIGSLTLSDIKQHRIIVSEDNLNSTQKNIILQMYNEDVLFIDQLKRSYA